MKKREENKSEFVIPFSGLKEARHSYEFEIDRKFFENIPESLIDDGNIKIDFVLEKRTNMLILEFEIQGSITVPCDRCMDDVNIPVESEDKLYVKFGEESLEETDDIITIPEAEYEIDIAPFIYEFVVLASPSRRVHEEDECNQEYLEKIEEYSHFEIDEEADEESDEDIDPRWAALKNLK